MLSGRHVAAWQPRIVRYFAYGSNLQTERLRARVPSAQPVMRATLTGYNMEFAKRSTRDGSAKCTIMPGAADDIVHGVVFSMRADEKKRLDDAEGLGSGYDDAHVTVQSGNQDVTAFTYIASPGHIDRSLKPFDWYKDFVLLGAVQHSLPSAWVDRIREADAIPDPNLRRAAENRAILPGELG